MLSHGHWDHGGGLLAAIESIAKRRGAAGRLLRAPGHVRAARLAAADGTMIVQEPVPDPRRD